MSQATGDFLSKIRAWSYRQQNFGRAAANPLEALRAVLAVYSSHPSAPLSLLCRSQDFTPTAFSELEQKRLAIRLPAMRASIFLVPVEFASRLFAATRMSPAKFKGSLAYAGLTWEEYTRLKEIVLAETQKPATPKMIQEAVKSDGAVMTAVKLMSREGLILRVGSSLRSDTLSYVSTAAWLGEPLAESDPVESLSWLGLEYLRIFGPARLQDFAWWAGVTVKQAKAALARPDIADIGDGWLLPSALKAEFAQFVPTPASAIDILPKWDAYTMAYAPTTRQRLVADSHLVKVYTNSSMSGKGATSGDGLPIVLEDDVAVAGWSHKFDNQNRLQITVTAFESRFDATNLLNNLQAFEVIGEVLGAAAVSVEITTAPAD